MKICKIYIKEFQQFRDVELDFTNPETDEPVDKVCLIGSNGTGKSTILSLIDKIQRELIFEVINQFQLDFSKKFLNQNTVAKILIRILAKNKTYFFYAHRDIRIILNGNSDKKEDAMMAEKILLVSDMNLFHTEEWKKHTTGTLESNFLNELLFTSQDNKGLLIYSPAESLMNNYFAVNDIPKTSAKESMNTYQAYSSYGLVSQDHLNNFWKLLVYNLRKRVEERESFENRKENIKKTKEQLIAEFEKMSPNILIKLSELWNKILAKAGLFFDVKNANNLNQLDDNLRIYIRLVSDGSKISYSELSTGIRNFIFRIGHIFSLYFNREIDKAIMLIDEPENSLYPDFLFDLVEIYSQIVVDKRGQNNTQMFFATHNPIIAAQFQPYERIILDWNEDGSVSARKGVAPVGDDPNDLLRYDFELTSLMGPEGRKMWEKYVDLKKKLIREKDFEKKGELIHEINQIGTLYNF